MLHKGSSGNVFDWLACAKKITNKWGNVKVYPLIPVWNESIQGELHRVILETGTAFVTLFGSDPRGMETYWDKLLTPTLPNTELTMDTYTLPYPASLTGPQTVKNITFKTSNPCPWTVRSKKY